MTVSHRPVPLFVNAAARGGNSARRLAGVEANPSIAMRPTRSVEELLSGLDHAVKQEHPRVLVAGGDGTLHRAIGVLAGTPCALGVVPTGTGNDLARTLGIGLDPLGAVRLGLTAPARRIDLGRIGDTPYLGVAAIGFDGAVLQFVEQRLRNRRGPWVYPYAALRTLMRFVPPRLTIEFDDGRFEGRAILAAVANSSTFGGGMRIAPDARLDDGLLDLVVIRASNKAALLPLLLRVYRGSHVRHPAVLVRRTRRVTLRSEPPLTIHGDGEAVVRTDATKTTVEAWAGALSVIA